MERKSRDLASTGIQCEHDLPMILDQLEAGYYARCQRCGKLGPVRDTPQNAWEALLNED
jgi:hypothetical protein